jgi:uncharacterized protein YcsI (UPF0317 family)
MEAGVSVRNVECDTLVPMFVSSLPCRPAGRFHGPMVVTMRPILEAQLKLVGEPSARYPHAHGAPIHIGAPEAIGIADLKGKLSGSAFGTNRFSSQGEFDMPTGAGAPKAP